MRSSPCDARAHHGHGTQNTRHCHKPKTQRFRGRAWGFSDKNATSTPQERKDANNACQIDIACRDRLGALRLRREQSCQSWPPHMARRATLPTNDVALSSHQTEKIMATVRLLTDEDLSPEARAVFADIRATRKSDFVNNFWRALAHDPVTLKRTWESVQAGDGSGRIGAEGQGDDLHRRLHRARLSLLHPFAHGERPREGDERRGISRSCWRSSAWRRRRTGSSPRSACRLMRNMRWGERC